MKTVLVCLVLLCSTNAFNLDKNLLVEDYNSEDFPVTELIPSSIQTNCTPHSPTPKRPSSSPCPTMLCPSIIRVKDWETIMHYADNKAVVLSVAAVAVSIILALLSFILFSLFYKSRGHHKMKLDNRNNEHLDSQGKRRTRKMGTGHNHHSGRETPVRQQVHSYRGPGSRAHYEEECKAIEDAPEFDIFIKIVPRNSSNDIPESFDLGQLRATRRRATDWEIDEPAYHPFVVDHTENHRPGPIPPPSRNASPYWPGMSRTNPAWGEPWNWTSDSSLHAKTVDWATITTTNGSGNYRPWHHGPPTVGKRGVQAHMSIIASHNAAIIVDYGENGFHKRMDRGEEMALVFQDLEKSPTEMDWD